MKNTLAIIPVSRFSQAKTRLSPTLTPKERIDLLKAMLKDVVETLKPIVKGVVLISADEDVLAYAYNLGIDTLQEEGKKTLNTALLQAMEWCSKQASQVLIMPSDVPLIREEQIRAMLREGENYPMVIAPAKGGGTNALLIPSKNFQPAFGDCSFFKHIEEARRHGYAYEIYDSFYMSLDVNTSEDLGEIMLHGQGTATYNYLQSLGLKVISNHGAERLRVTR